MWTSIGKLEIKKGLFYYLLLYLFFFFWSTFTLFALFFYTNINHISDNFNKKRGFSILFYPQGNLKTFEDIKGILTNLNYIKKYQVIPPRELLASLEINLPKELLDEKDLYNFLPYLIRIDLISPDKSSQLKMDLQMYEKMFNITFEFISEPHLKSLYFWQYSNIVILAFIFLWNLFYLLFFYFLIKTLNSHLKEHNEIFQFLGGSIFNLLVIRFAILVFPLILLLILSFLFYFYILSKLIYYFPVLKIFPNLNNIFELSFFAIYLFFLIFIYPIYLLILSLRKI
ncbi:hypothetical protein THC_0528 [Caldimicrobium thiodismutans]|uniref:Cell division protein FtsX n=1 Tax=Caldimicrobium thiodismutans TaxID=1653476 RepID=A0A0U4W195_9BACT|nr:hypothetical protein THC_0528 [Caldimicrobium thiodismutans]